MKHLLCVLTLMTALLCLHSKAISQSLEQRLNQRRPSCSEIFTNAMEVLPELKSNDQMDSVAYVINYIEHSCEKTIELFNLKVLLAIEHDQFKTEAFYDPLTIDNLDRSAYSYSAYLNNPHYTSKGQVAYYQFTAAWAEELIRRKRLDENEMLICQVLAGQEKEPSQRIKKDKTTYPFFFSLLKQQTEQVRKSAQGLVSFMGGYWIPTNNMTILGAHPSFGFQLGARHNRNEFDLTLQFKVGSTGNKYTVLRNGITYDLTYFFGGYIGFDYTRYFIRSNSLELGWEAGMGYDGFDISSESDDYMKPTSIGSFNANTGLRFNYFYSNRNYIGLLARYNAVNYKNSGGSSLKGDSFSIDFVLGFTSH